MVKNLSLLLSVAFLFSVSSVTYAQTASGNPKHIFESHLSGSEEIPPVQTSANGTLKATIPHGEGSFDYVLRVNANNVTGAHFHCGARWENGPVVVPLFEGTARNVNGVLAEGKINMSSLLEGAKNCSTRIDSVEHLVQAMRDGKIYVNVHTTNNPNGEVRGQLVATYDSTGYLKVSTTTHSGGVGTTTETLSSSTRVALISQLESLLRQLIALLQSQNNVNSK